MTCANNGKVYIGLSKNPQARFREHVRNPGNTKLRADMLKYKRGAFRLEVMHRCESRAEARALEKACIAECDSIKNGYNVLKGEPFLDRKFWAMKYKKG